MDILEKQVKIFNIFKETAANNIGLIHGFPNWTNRIYFTTEGDDLLIHVPPVLINRGGYEFIEKSKRRKEADKFMRKKTYTYLEYVIKTTCSVYAATIEKQVSPVGGFFGKENT